MRHLWKGVGLAFALVGLAPAVSEADVDSEVLLMQTNIRITTRQSTAINSDQANEVDPSVLSALRRPVKQYHRRIFCEEPVEFDSIEEGVEYVVSASDHYNSYQFPGQMEFEHSLRNDDTIERVFGRGHPDLHEIRPTDLEIRAALDLFFIVLQAGEPHSDHSRVALVPNFRKFPGSDKFQPLVIQTLPELQPPQLFNASTLNGTHGNLTDLYFVDGIPVNNIITCETKKHFFESRYAEDPDEELFYATHCNVSRHQGLAQRKKHWPSMAPSGQPAAALSMVSTFDLNNRLQSVGRALLR